MYKPHYYEANNLKEKTVTDKFEPKIGKPYGIKSVEEILNF